MSDEYYLISPQTYDDQFWWKKDDIEFWKTVIPQYSKVLELAAGTARIGKPLVKSDIDYTGLELSSDYVSFANLKFPNHNPIIQGDMRKFSLNTKYDVILIGFNSLLHLLSEDEVSMCLDNIRSHMHNDTKLYIDIFVPKPEFLYRSPQSNLIVMEFFDSDDYHESNEAKLEKLEKLDWFIIWSRTEAGEFRTEGGQHEGNYSSKELNMEDCLLTYRDLPLVIPSNGTDIFSNELEIHFVDETRASLEMSES